MNEVITVGDTVRTRGGKTSYRVLSFGEEEYGQSVVFLRSQNTGAVHKKWLKHLKKVPA